SGVNIVQAMAIPAAGMTLGMLVAVFFSYPKPRHYLDRPIVGGTIVEPTPTRYNLIMSVVAIVATFAIQLIIQFTGSEADVLLLDTLVGLGLFLISGVYHGDKADVFFSSGLGLTALIGLVMISAQGFAAVINKTNHIAPLVASVQNFSSENKAV